MNVKIFKSFMNILKSFIGHFVREHLFIYQNVSNVNNFRTINFRRCFGKFYLKTNLFCFILLSKGDAL